MRILVAVDGSSYGEAAVQEICNRPWPAGSEVNVLSVAHAMIPEAFDPFFFMYAAHEEMLEEERKRAPERAEKAAQQIREKVPELQVTTTILEGSPKKAIVEEAERWNADLIVLGAHGYGFLTRFLLGSVSHAVVLHAPCSVEVVRIREPDFEA